MRHGARRFVGLSRGKLGQPTAILLDEDASEPTDGWFALEPVDCALWGMLYSDTAAMAYGSPPGQ